MQFSQLNSLGEFLTIVRLAPEKYGTTADIINTLPTVAVTSSLSDAI
jgi:hypothetical protein